MIVPQLHCRVPNGRREFSSGRMPSTRWALAAWLLAAGCFGQGNGRQDQSVATENRESRKPAPAEHESWNGPTPAERLTLRPGFEAELLYAVPRERYGSWICLAVDPRGRIIASAESGGLYRITPGRDASERAVAPLNVAIGAAQGLLWAFDSLYVVVNGAAAEGPGLYRLRDRDGDDAFDEVERLKAFAPGAPGDEHGPHGVVLGPDGMLYVVAGNVTQMPDERVDQSPYRNWADDVLLPQLPSSIALGPPAKLPGGWIARTDRDGAHWEIVCGGLRNPYDLAFNRDGELFTADADMEFDWRTPWYRPARVNHCVSGAEFGWRPGSGKWPDDYPDSVGSVVDFGLGSPAGMTFGTGTRFPAKYQRALFVCDWTRGTLHAVHLHSDGASYTGTFETFLEGNALPLVDVLVGRDGALYVLTGGRGTQSALYRIRFQGTADTGQDEQNSSTEEIAGADARRVRRELERFHRRPDPTALKACWPYLSSPDRALQFAARVAVEHQPVDTWAERALSETNVQAAINALLALSRTGNQDRRDALFDALDRIPLEGLDQRQALDVLRTYQVALARLGRPGDATAGGMIAKFDALFPASSARINRELFRLLTFLKADSIVPKGMELLDGATTQEEQLFYAMLLRHARSGWNLPLRTEYFRWLRKAGLTYPGGDHFRTFVIRILEDALQAGLPFDEQAVAAAAHQSGTASPETTLPPPSFVHNWQMEDLLPVFDRIAPGRAAPRGEQALQKAACLKCHRWRGEGGSIGPDLTNLGRRFGPRELLESILEPSAVISDQYAETKVVARDGRVYVGRIQREDSDELVLQSGRLLKETVTIPREEIEFRERSRVSSMPSGTVNVLTRDELIDLVNCLLTVP